MAFKIGGFAAWRHWRRHIPPKMAPFPAARNNQPQPRRTVESYFWMKSGN
jgi:hypothetical protein